MIAARLKHAVTLGGLSQRDRRAILLGLLVAVPVLAYMGAIRPYFAALQHTREQIAAERSLLQRELELMQAKSALPGQLADAKVGLRRAQDRLVRAPNTTLAESRMTDLLEELATMTRVLLQEVRTSPAPRGEAAPEGMQVLRLAVRGESDLEGVLKYLQHIEENPVALRIHELSLEPAPPQVPERATRGRPARRPLNADAGVIQFTVVVEAFTPATTSGTELP